jgi:hypothetical protein
MNKKIMSQVGSLLGIAALFSAGTCNLQAQGQHYPVGAEGIEAGSLPPNGIFFRDYNQLYHSEHYPGGPANFNATAYVNVPRVIWMTDWTILGARYGMDVLVPLVYTDMRAGAFHGSRFGVGDMLIDPLDLSWNFDKFDVAFSYGLWVPNGDFSTTDPASPGKGFWSNMLTLGATWHPDAEKSWSLSALNRYEIHTDAGDLGFDPGDTYSLEWGLSKNFNKTVDVGLVGYYQQQVNGAHPLSHVAAVGPEVRVFCPVVSTFVSLRYEYEFGADNRPEGHAFCLTLTKCWIKKKD